MKQSKLMMKNETKVTLCLLSFVGLACVLAVCTLFGTAIGILKFAALIKWVFA